MIVIITINVSRLSLISLSSSLAYNFQFEVFERELQISLCHKNEAELGKND